MNLSRSVVRRIIGRGTHNAWSVVSIANARVFAAKCGGRLEDIQWTANAEPEPRPRPSRSASLPHAQRVRWGPVDGLPAGVNLLDDMNRRQSFIPWTDLRRELEAKLLPQLFANPQGYRFVIMDHHGKRDWVGKILDANDRGYCWVWLGVNPDNHWQWDGLVRVGGNDPPCVWQTYERYSDGSYRRIQSAYKTLEEAADRSGV